MTYQQAAVKYTQARTDRLKGLITKEQLAEAARLVLEVDHMVFAPRMPNPNMAVPFTPQESTWARLTDLF